MNVKQIIRKLDEYLSTEDIESARRFLDDCIVRARDEHDAGGELTMLNEIIGLSRRVQDEAWGLGAVWRALELVRTGQVADETACATTMLNAATTLKTFGAPEEAVKYYEKAMRVYDRVLTADDPRQAGLRNNMAMTLLDLGRYDEAEKLLYEAIDILKKQDHAGDTAVSYVNLADLYAVMYQPQEREQKIRNCLDRALDILTGEGLVRNSDYAFTCRKCASGFRAYGYDEEAQLLEDAADWIYSRAQRAQE